MQHRFHDVSVRAGRDRDTRVAFHRVAAGAKAGGGDTLARLRGDVRQLEDRTAHLRVAIEDRQQQRSNATPHIDDPAEIAKRVMRAELGVNALCAA